MVLRAAVRQLSGNSPRFFSKVSNKFGSASRVAQAFLLLGVRRGPDRTAHHTIAALHLGVFGCGRRSGLADSKEDRGIPPFATSAMDSALLTTRGRAARRGAERSGSGSFRGFPIQSIGTQKARKPHGFYEAFVAAKAATHKAFRFFSMLLAPISYEQSTPFADREQQQIPRRRPERRAGLGMT